METIGFLVTSLLLIFIAASPAVAVANGYGFVKGLVVSLPICIILIITLYWWNDYYPDFRLEMMGFDFNGVSDSERLRNVPLELQAKATKLYYSRFGIGWPLKAIFGMVLVTPYILVVLGGAVAIKRLRKNKK